MRFADLDQDGDSELFIGVQSGVFGTDFKDNFLFYENVGSDTVASFIHKRNSFLKTLDFGSASVPVFADIDNDGDDDLFVGNEFNDELPGLRGTVFFLSNSGEQNMYLFNLEDSTYFPDLTGNNLVPAFGDLDSDGDLDAIIGDWNGKLYHYNNSGTSESAVFEYRGQFLDLDVGGLAHPSLGDIDGDNDIDLLVGNDNGKILYWRNIGTPNAPEFYLETEDLFKGIEIGFKTAPRIVDLDRDGNLDILIGTLGGQLFSAFENGGIWSTQEFKEIPFAGKQIAPAVTDLDGDGHFEMMLGSIDGGLQLFRLDNSLGVKVVVPSPEKIKLIKAYPNPFNNHLTISFTVLSQGFVNFSIFDLLGQHRATIIDTRLDVGQYNFSWEAKNISSGIYILMMKNVIQSHPTSYSQKIIYMK